MKNLFITTVLALSIAISSIASDRNSVNYKAERNFAVEFADAKNVNWTATEKYTKASFTMNQVTMEAFYDHQGNYIGTSSKIDIGDLPISGKRSFAKKYAAYTVKEVIKFEGTDETAYYLVAENEEQSLYVKVSVEGFVSVFKKVTNKTKLLNLQ
ncbi:MAG TPA: hypothetical protein VF622_05135 [Segetibacter sp.]|jgi:hypothetical protein